MMKITRYLLVIAASAMLFCIGVLLADKEALRTQIVRLHVVADSDSTDDQAAKIAVKDNVTAYLQGKLLGIDDIAAARKVVVNELGALEEIANDTLAEIGSTDMASVTFTTEEFDRREYDTFLLPAGIYESVRVQIGSGEGKNWWCVVFPSLCVPSSVEHFQATAVSSGFEQGLVDSLTNDHGFEIRFFLLDCMGIIENFFNNSEK